MTPPDTSDEVVAVDDEPKPEDTAPETEADEAASPSPPDAPPVGPPPGEPIDAPAPIFALGEQGAVPLAAVFKIRKKSRRRRRDEAGGFVDDRAEPEDVASPLRDADEPPRIRAVLPATQELPASDTQPDIDVGARARDGYDVVLTDAFRVEGESVPPVGEAPPRIEAEALDTPPPMVFEPTEEMADDLHEAIVDPGPQAADYQDIDDESLEAADDTEPALLVGLRDLPVDLDPIVAVDAVLGMARRHAEGHRTPTAGSWFAEMFGRDYLLAHPLRYGGTSEIEARYVEDALSVARGGRLLDLACGYGRHTIPLARSGYEMVGLDLSLDMLQEALNHAQSEGLSIKFVHGDMRDLNFQEVFDGVYSFDTSFGYFTESENLLVLAGVHRALKRGGRFVLDVVNRDYAVREIPLRNWWEGDGCLVQEDIEFDYGTSRLQVKRFVVFADGMQREYNVALRLYGHHELQRMLEIVGFTPIEVSGGVHTRGSFFGAPSARLMFVAEKRS